jgi:hypothetical protein
MHRLISGILILAIPGFACAYVPSIPTSIPRAIPTGAILFQDDFSSQASGWDRLSTGEGIMDYDAGGYRILVNALQTNFWSTPRREFADVRIEVDTGKLGGPDENRAGLLCRMSGNDYYFFLITSDGYYAIGLYSGGRALLLGQDELRTSAHIRTGLAVNHLRADCIGDSFTFYVNGVQLAQVRDAALKSGDIGLLAGTFALGGVDVIFDNFVVIQP